MPFDAASSNAPPPLVSDQIAKWESMYRTHSADRQHMFKDRRYLLHAFPLLQAPALRVLEIGCGNGSSTLPILRDNALAHVHATDPSATAVELTRRVCETSGFAARLSTEIQADDGAPLGGAAHGAFDVAMLVFTLSAVPRPDDEALIRRVAAALRPGGRLLFRDYGECDLRMLRDAASAAGAPVPKSAPPDSGRDPPTPAPPSRPPAPTSTRLSEREFVRPGGMFRRYYSLEDVGELARTAHLDVEEVPRYCCVRLENRRRALTMERVYVQAVLRKRGG